MSAPAPPAPRPIRRLDPATVERIAAGEVVERPASVVKELVENAIDAGARKISVRIRGGGLERIEVADDGAGIRADELPLAVERHATSKLAPGAPLDRIGTLGFRGEALASVASVSRLRLSSRPVGAELAEGVEVTSGALGASFAEPRDVGTTVRADDLFFNTPARRKFLRAPAAELVEIVRTVERLYLARPDVALRIESEGREVAQLPAARTLRDAARAVLGPEFPAGSFELDRPVPGGHVRAVLGVPALAAPTSTGLYLSVNGRPILSRALAQAVRLGYGDTIARTRHPIGVVHLELDLDRLDVNVHPTKREVRFVGERELSDALRHAVRAALVAVPTASEISAVRAGAVPSPGRGDRGATGRPAPRTPFPPGTGPPPRPRVQALLDGAAGPTTAVPRSPAGRRPALELLGTLDRLYWVAASDDGLVLIDQHAVSERCLFEALRSRRTIARQTLVEPVLVELPASERAALGAHAELVRAAGFEVEPFGPGVDRLLTVPVYRGRTARPEALREMLRELAGEGRPTVPDDLVDRRTATIACHAAIRAGDAVDAATLAELLRELDRLDVPATSCPHGRPIMVRLPRARLDRWFLRQGA